MRGLPEVAELRVENGTTTLYSAGVPQTLDALTSVAAAHDDMLNGLVMRVLIALTQTAIIIGVGVALFGLSMAGSGLVFGGMLLLGTLAFIAIAFLIAAIAKTEESGSALTSALQLPMLFLSGIFFPIEALPDFLRPVTNALPLTYLADALRQTMVGATPYHSMALNALVLLGWLVVSGLLAIRNFRWE